jgi:hypothetical protein
MYNPIRSRIKEMSFSLMIMAFLTTLTVSAIIIAIKDRAKSVKNDAILTEIM